MAASAFTEDMDFALAFQLQEEEDRLRDEEMSVLSSQTPTLIRKEEKPTNSKLLSVADPKWEGIDPVPDVHGLFLEFNDAYFWGKLVGIEVKWSPKMTLCAGLCCYEGRGGLCSVRLSEPLLKFRPRKDLVQTLLHEMIHAYLFVTANNKDHDAHGPEFLSHMNRINKISGANVTVYHNFHDEVNHYRTHWWLCDGPCKNRAPYFGYVKRAMNRPPGSYDTWWNEHQATCGGKFVKVKEPEGFGDKKRKNGETTLPDAKRQHTETKPKIVPFSGTGHVLGSSSPQSQQPSIVNFLQPIKVTPEDNHRNRTVLKPKKKCRPGDVITLNEYFETHPRISRRTRPGEQRRQHSVCRGRKTLTVPLYLTDSDSDDDFEVSRSEISRKSGEIPRRNREISHTVTRDEEMTDLEDRNEEISRLEAKNNKILRLKTESDDEISILDVKNEGIPRLKSVKNEEIQRLGAKNNKTSRLKVESDEEISDLGVKNEEIRRLEDIKNEDIQHLEAKNEGISCVEGIEKTEEIQHSEAKNETTSQSKTQNEEISNSSYKIDEIPPEVLEIALQENPEFLVKNEEIPPSEAINSEIPTETLNTVPCPVCTLKIELQHINDHIDVCLLLVQLQ